MHKTPHTADRVLESKWFTGGLLAASALLISPTFVLGYLASTPLRAALLMLPTAAYGAVFHVIFEDRTPVGVEEVTAAYRTLALWTAVIGSAAPFIAGAIFRRAWRATSPRQVAMMVIAAFCVLAGGSYLVTDKTDALSSASSIAVGRSQALAALEAEASALSMNQPDSPEARAVRLLSSRVAVQILGGTTQTPE